MSLVPSPLKSPVAGDAPVGRDEGARSSPIVAKPPLLVPSQSVICPPVVAPQDVVAAVAVEVAGRRLRASPLRRWPSRFRCWWRSCRWPFRANPSAGRCRCATAVAASVAVEIACARHMPVSRNEHGGIAAVVGEPAVGRAEPVGDRPLSLRHRMSSRPSPFKSAMPATCQSSDTLVVAFAFAAEAAVRRT